MPTRLTPRHSGIEQTNTLKPPVACVPGRSTGAGGSGTRLPVARPRANISTGCSHPTGREHAPHRRRWTRTRRASSEPTQLIHPLPVCRDTAPAQAGHNPSLPGIGRTTLQATRKPTGREHAPRRGCSTRTRRASSKPFTRLVTKQSPCRSGLENHLYFPRASTLLPRTSSGGRTIRMRVADNARMLP